MLTLQAAIAAQVAGELGEVPELRQPGRLVVAVGQPQFPNERLVISVAFRATDGTVTLLAQHSIALTGDVMFDIPLPAPHSAPGLPPEPDDEDDFPDLRLKTTAGRWVQGTKEIRAAFAAGESIQFPNGAIARPDPKRPGEFIMEVP